MILSKLYSNKHHNVQEEVLQVLTEDVNNEILLTGVLLIIYRLRNNMFHGLKDCYSINSQLNLFKSANIALNELIKIQLIV
ncbi:MAG: hypothetical protein K2I70_00215 [Bacilli bacterium]|nr:hypothetical protein [Bacilli bacterium]